MAMSMFCTMSLFKLMGTGFVSQMLPFFVQGLLDNVFLALAIAWEQFQHSYLMESVVLAD